MENKHKKACFSETSLLFYVKESLAALKEVSIDSNNPRQNVSKNLYKQLKLMFSACQHNPQISKQHDLVTVLHELRFFWEVRDLKILEIFDDMFFDTVNHLAVYTRQLEEFSKDLCDYLLSYYANFYKVENDSSKDILLLQEQLNSAIKQIYITIDAVLTDDRLDIKLGLAFLLDRITDIILHLSKFEDRLKEAITCLSLDNTVYISKVSSGILLWFRLNGWCDLEATESEKGFVCITREYLNNCSPAKELINVTLDGSQLSLSGHDIEGLNALLSDHSNHIGEFHLLNCCPEQNEFDYLIPNLNNAKNLTVVEIANVQLPIDSAMENQLLKKLICLLKAPSIEKVSINNIQPTFSPKQFFELSNAIKQMKKLKSLDLSQLFFEDPKADKDSLSSDNNTFNLSTVVVDLIRYQKTILDGQLTKQQLKHKHHQPIITALKKNNIHYAYNIASIFAEQKYKKDGFFYAFKKRLLYKMLKYCLQHLPHLNIDIDAFVIDVFSEKKLTLQAKQGTQRELKRMKR